MGVGRGRQAQGRCSRIWRGVETSQVGAADHVGDALPGVVHHHRELVGVDAVGAAQDEVADGLRATSWRMGPWMRSAKATSPAGRAGAGSAAARPGGRPLRQVPG